MNSIYLINPKSDYPSYFSAEVFGQRAHGKRVALVADLAITTVAAMAPPAFHTTLVDENIADIDFDHDSDVIGLTGKVSQWARMRVIADEFRRRGKLVVIGGPFASLSPHLVRPHCDIIVQGEGEEVLQELFSDLHAERWKEQYMGGRPDLSLSPIPRWSLYPNDRAISACVQTSRGCPFECEFCDVIQYLGRRQRHKPVAQVISELDEIYRHGYRAVFLCDDNFTVHRARAKELLRALRDWNDGCENGKVEFATQVSIDAARDGDLLELCAQAGLIRCFIGIETTNQDSLRETKKRQNLRVDLAAEIQRFYDHGIQVIAGLIVGFDHDTLAVFEQQYEFAMTSGVPILTVGTLVAPYSTPLHNRLKAEGRLIDTAGEAESVPWDTNIIPKGMTREELLHGIRTLCNRLYTPEAFGDRVLDFIDRVGDRRDPARIEERSAGRDVEFEALNLIAEIPKMGEAEERMWFRIAKALRKKREFTRPVFAALMQYRQIRHMYDTGSIWNPYMN